MVDEVAPKRGRGRPKGGTKKRGIGHNGPSEDDVRIASTELSVLKEEQDAIKLKIKLKRNVLKQNGFTMHLLDRRIKMLSMTPQEQKAEYLTDLHYGKALRQPVGDLLDLFEEREGGDDPDYGERFWHNRGLQAGGAGVGWPDEPPDGCPPEFAKAWADGHEEGSEEVRAAFLKRQESNPLPPPVNHSLDDVEESGGPTEDETEFEPAE